MIELNIAEMEAYNGVLPILMREKLPAKISYWLSKLSGKVESELKHYDDIRLKTLKDFAEVDGNGNLILGQNNNAIFPDEESEKAFMKEIDELRAQTVEFKIDPISINTLANYSIEGAILRVLEKLIVD
jgi:hypothetical protein